MSNLWMDGCFSLLKLLIAVRSGCANRKRSIEPEREATTDERRRLHPVTNQPSPVWMVGTCFNTYNFIEKRRLASNVELGSATKHGKTAARILRILNSS